MIEAEHLREGWPLAETRPGKWVLSRPLDGPFINTLKDAWAVLRRRCVAVRFEDQ